MDPAHLQIVAYEPPDGQPEFGNDEAGRGPDDDDDHDPGEPIEDDDGQKKKRNLPKTRARFSIYQKMQAVREAERLIESGLKVGIEKKVMDTFPELFRSAKGNLKTGMLGRWISQSKAQEWHKIPFEKMSAADRDAIKELPDWIREPLGMQKRMRFKGSSDVPAVVKERLLNMVEKVGCGGKKSKPTAGVVVTSKIKAEADSMLETYCKHLDKVAADEGKDAPPCKRKVSTRWVNRLLLSAGYKKRVPNTAGAYLPYDDSRMIKSRKAWHFRRQGFGF